MSSDVRCSRLWCRRLRCRPFPIEPAPQHVMFCKRQLVGRGSISRVVHGRAIILKSLLPTMSTLYELPLIATNAENSAYMYLALVEYQSNLDDGPVSASKKAAETVSALEKAALEVAVKAAPTLCEEATESHIAIWQVRALSMLYSDTSSHCIPTIRWTTIFGQVLRIRLRRN